MKVAVATGAVELRLKCGNAAMSPVVGTMARKLFIQFAKSLADAGSVISFKIDVLFMIFPVWQTVKARFIRVG